ncbi:uncharacterized protein K02A2.6-like [Sabethes cyaneus]|uniref:uncharacterized protein K02A2.6-like n=1 Tax=Sabethes cyaneus TaxID=53552 RepID=UPI00237DC481|nr:uncharacterized protein K02A2.6-like [Sabethes cyaneus]
MSTPGMIGTIDHFHVGRSFTNYIERFEILCNLNNVTPETKKSWFISLSGDEVFDEIKLLFPNQDVNSLTYDTIINKLKLRFDKTEPALMHRYKFYNRCQGQNETAENFVLAIKLLAETCNFREFKNEAIRDKLIIGLRDKILQHKLLMEDDIQLDAVEKMIINDELAGQRARLISEQGDRSAVLSIKNRLGRKGDWYDRRGSDYNGFKNDYVRRNNDDRRYRSRSRSWERGFNRHKRDWNDYSTAICNFCKRKGHIRKNCRLMHRDNIKFVDQDQNKETAPIDKFDRMKLRESSVESDLSCMKISSIKKINEPCMIKAIIENRKLLMEIDTGSAVTVISEILYHRLFKFLPILRCGKKLAVVDGAKLCTVGQMHVNIVINEIKGEGQLIILKSEKDFTPLLGRDWLEIFYPAWKNQFTSINMIKNWNIDDQRKDAMSIIQHKFSKIFTKDFSEPIVGYEADLIFKPEQPIFKRAYQVPYKVKDKFMEHLDMLEKQDVITPVKASEWASPVIAVLKKDEEIRMVIDCKVSLNKILIPNSYPLPLAQDIFATLADSKVFCSLDLAGAYTQLKLSTRSKKYVVINTVKGLYTYNRLPQGASSSAALFQQVMDQILRGLEGVCSYLDDVLVAGKTFKDCFDKLMLVLERLSDANIRVNFKKCKFFVESLQYLGHLVTGNGLLPSPEKLSTIKNAKTPENVTELKAYLGLINFYNKFIPNMSTKLGTLYNLLKKNVRFVWSKECDDVFQESKENLLNAELLEFYDSNKPLVVVTDASSYGLGGVLAHKMGQIEKPICFTSFSLNCAQKKYPILHLEALALVCTLKKFHKFLFGQKFTVFTDHKPLIGIFGKHGKHSVYVTRLQRYVMELSIYNFDIEYRPASKMGNADFCSRFPLDQKVPRMLDEEQINSLNFTNDLPLDFACVARETRNDQFLKEIAKFTVSGWPKATSKEFRNFYAQKEKLEVVDDVILFESRVVVPNSLKSNILRLMHSNHEGIVKMKKIARRAVYWQGMNGDIEEFVKTCNSCAKMGVIPNPHTEGSWLPTTRPFSRIHADFFYFRGKTFLLVIDSYSKWLEVEIMYHGTTAKMVNRKFASIFARFGLPDVVVTDGGPPFSSREFVNFLERQGIKVFKSPPYNPQSNGQAERLVRVVKDVLKKFILDTQTKSLDIEDQLNLFLMNHRNGSLGTEGRFPSEQVFSFNPKTILDLINPINSYKRYIDKPPENVINCDYEAVTPVDGLDKLVAGDRLYYKNNNKDVLDKWLEARLIKKISKNIFQVSLGSHVLIAHRHQLKMLHEPKRHSVVVLATSNGRVGEYDESKGSRDTTKEIDERRQKRKRCYELARSPIRTRAKDRQIIRSISPKRAKFSISEKEEN